MFQEKKINLHIHSNYSDGKHSIYDIIKFASKYELEYIAITDHFSNTWKANIIPTLDNHGKIQAYLDEIDSHNHSLKENDQNLRVLKGIEIDIGSSESHILNLVKPRLFDIVLFEYVETPEAISFIQNIIYKWERRLKGKQMPLLGLAHFDPSFFAYRSDDVLFSFLVLNQIFYEFNASYSHHYSTRYRPFFVKLKDKQVLVSIGSDSHSVSGIGNIKDPLQAIWNFGLEKHYIRFIAELDYKFKNQR